MSKKKVEEIVRLVERTNKRFEAGMKKRVEEDRKRAKGSADDFCSQQELYYKEVRSHHEG